MMEAGSCAPPEAWVGGTESAIPEAVLDEAQLVVCLQDAQVCVCAGAILCGAGTVVGVEECVSMKEAGIHRGSVELPSSLYSGSFQIDYFLKGKEPSWNVAWTVENIFRVTGSKQM
jgi:hypothetical protein